MKFIRCEFKSIHEGIAKWYLPTLDALRAYIKGLPRDAQKHIPQHEHYDFYEVEIQTDKESMVSILNGDIPAGKELRSFFITNRGGLKENLISK